MESFWKKSGKYLPASTAVLHSGFTQDYPSTCTTSKGKGKVYLRKIFLSHDVL